MSEPSQNPLRDLALAVRENAHAPYSDFKVGAALRTVSGNVYVGCNVENVAYPEGTCAEAGAIAAMVAAGETELSEVYVVAGFAQSGAALRGVSPKACGVRGRGGSRHNGNHRRRRRAHDNRAAAARCV